MEYIYISKKSRYHFDGESLIRINGENETNWGKAFYTTKRDLQEVLRDCRVKVEERKSVGNLEKKKIEKELDKRRLDPSGEGGIFVTLVKDSEMEFYTIYWSSEIMEIEERDVVGDSGTYLAV